MLRVIGIIKGKTANVKMAGLARGYAQWLIPRLFAPQLVFRVPTASFRTLATTRSLVRVGQRYFSNTENQPEESTSHQPGHQEDATGATAEEAAASTTDANSDGRPDENELASMYGYHEVCRLSPVSPHGPRTLSSLLLAGACVSLEARRCFEMGMDKSNYRAGSAGFFS
eukprot:gb/GECG01008766.1/.p1 GENE.gb/GECG01008766.1/~~gb/GECG01008766.1/.p1  ORF type:complete len:170 (+),score=14.08 gb/GECG01008766.1/:1-510(+)